MADVNALFLGVTTSPTREFVGGVAAAGQFSRFHYPCAGRFAAISAAVSKGVPPGRVFASDISLFSSVIGYLADPSKSVFDLGIDVRGPAREFLADAGSDPLVYAAGVMLAVKYLTIGTAKQFDVGLRREVWAGRAAYRENIRAKLEKFVARIRGVRYDLRDVRDVGAEAAADPASFLYASMPWYEGGYTKMYAAIRDHLSWAEPNVSEFSPDETPAFLESVGGVRDGDRPRPLVMAFISHGLGACPDGWEPVLAVPVTDDRVDYVVSNRPLDRRYADLKIDYKPARRFEIYDDQEITPDSVVRFVPVDKHTCLYYRDLFVHRLGSVNAGEYSLLTIDGRVVTAAGFDSKFICTGASEYLYEIFGVTRQSARYRRLSKLYVMLTLAGEFRASLLRQRQYTLREPRGIRTLCINKGPEGQLYRGVMRMVDRKKDDSGYYHLVYVGEFGGKSYADVIREWLGKYGKN